MTNENKRINIQYSIDLSELPDEVERLYSKAQQEFKQINFPKLQKGTILDHSTVKKADEIRQRIVKLDLILADVQSIVSAYVEYELNKNNPQPETTTPNQQVNGMPDMSDFDLSEMSKLFNGGENIELQEPNQRSE